MISTPENIHSIDALRTFIHTTLCEKENLLADQFGMSEIMLIKRGRECGMQFLLQGPRSVRLGAIWAAEQNIVYFYDAQGERYKKVRLSRHIQMNEIDSRVA